MPPAARVLAHAFGQRYSLPVPLTLFVVGGAVVVFVSFVIVLPRSTAGTTMAAWGGGSRARLRPLTWGHELGLAVLIAAVTAGLVGTNSVAENILPTFFWLLIWIVVPISCALIGDWTQLVNPYGLIARLADNPGLRRAVIAGDELRWPSWAGYWPAVGLFFVVACGELVFNATATLPQFTAIALIVYAVVTAMGSFFFGAEVWLSRAELFSVLFRTWGRLGWWRFGAPGRSGFFGGLGTGFDQSVSRITFVLLLLVSVSYDGLLATPAWKTARLHLPGGITPGSPGYLALTTAALVVLVCVAWGLLLIFAAAVARAGSISAGRVATVSRLLPSLLPISFGYLVAHNLEYIAINGQLLIPLAGDPLGRGWHLLPSPFNDGYRINVNLLPSSIGWYVEVALIVAVHVAAVVIAHRHLAGLAPSQRAARRSEWPWMVAMVAYTMTSLWLLSQPLVDESQHNSSASTGAVTNPPGSAAAVDAMSRHTLQEVALSDAVMRETTSQRGTL